MASNTFATNVDPLHVEAVIRRLKEVYGVETNTDLAHCLKVSSITFLSSYKKRGRLPLNIMLRVSLEKKISFDWILYGDERKVLKVPGQRALSA